MNRIKYLVLTAALMLCSCSEHNESVYLDVSEIEEKLSSASELTVTDTVDIDDSALVFLHSAYSFSSDRFIICEYDTKLNIDLASGIVSTLCDVPGCVHDPNNSKDCFVYRNISSPHLTREGMYFTEYNSEVNCGICFKSGSKTETVFKNDFRSDLDRELEPDGDTAGCRYFIRDGVMYAMGLNWFYTVDMQTMTKTCEPVLLGESPIFNADVYGDKFYYSNENLELYSYDMKTAENKKLADKVWRLQPSVDGLYYLEATEGNRENVMYLPYDEGEAKQIAQDAYIEMYVTDKSVYYLTDSGLMQYDKASKTVKKIELSITYENGEKYDMKGISYVKLISCPSSEYVYLLDYDVATGAEHRNTLFRIKKDISEVRGISLGIYMQSDGDKGRIISW